MSHAYQGAEEWGSFVTAAEKSQSAGQAAAADQFRALTGIWEAGEFFRAIDGAKKEKDSRNLGRQFDRQKFPPKITHTLGPDRRKFPPKSAAKNKNNVSKSKSAAAKE